MYREPTFAERARTTKHRSLFRDRLHQLAGTRAIADWLVEEANVRGYFGVTALEMAERPRQAEVSDEQIIVGLLMPHADLDVRLFKLVVRMMQRAPLDPRRLWLETRKERADAVLFWLLQQIPREERTPELERIAVEQPEPPRGYRPLPIQYDSSRLIRRPASRESTWRAARR